MISDVPKQYSPGRQTMIYLLPQCYMPSTHGYVSAMIAIQMMLILSVCLHEMLGQARSITGCITSRAAQHLAMQLA